MNRKVVDLFLKSKISTQDQETIYQWFTDQKTEHESNVLLKNLWESVDKTKTVVDADMDEVLKQLLEKIEEEKTVPSPDQQEDYKQKQFKLKNMGSSILKYAAVIAFAFGLAYVILLQHENPEVVEQTALIEKSTSRGQKSHIILKDGSKITLNAESKVLFDRQFGISNRDILLEGEAYFEVAKNKKLPFNVSVNNVTTTALGTSFNINAYFDEPYLSISLVSGNVEVVNKNGKNADKEKVLLEPGQVYITANNHTAAVSEVTTFDTQSVTAWKNNILYFENTEVEEVISKLERWYDVEIVVVNPNKMAGIQGTGQFNNESLNNVLRVLSYSLKFEYQQDDKQITIEFN